MRRIKWILGAILFAVLLPGCGQRVVEGFRLLFVPKLTSIPYFQACKKGAEEAAKELGIQLTYDGPNKADVNEQIEILSNAVASGEYQALAVACNEPDRIDPVLQQARDKGMPVITYDADSRSARDFFVNQATYEAVAEAMADAMSEQLPNAAGKVGILTSFIHAPNQSEWARRLRAYAAKKYPGMTLLPEEEHGEDRNPGIRKARAMIASHKDLKGIIGLTSVAVPAAAEAVRQENKKGEIVVTGVSTPRDMREYLMDDTVKTVILWNPVDLGYLTVYVVHLHRQGKMPKGGTGTIRAGRLGEIEVRDGVVLLGRPLRITKANVDSFDF
jgi:ABC-type sugar transport system substrate-binding protein